MNIRTFITTGLLGLVALTAVSNGHADMLETSPPVPDVLRAVTQMSGRLATVGEPDFTGFEKAFFPNGGELEGDHIQGITLTASGRLVVSYSDQSELPSRCGGILAASKNRFDPANPDVKLNWEFYCQEQHSLEAHPSSIQASGDVVIIGTHGGSRFFHVPADGGIEPLTHLAIKDGGRDASGLAYNHRDHRYYALNAAGPVTPGRADTTICRTAPYMKLHYEDTKFFDCKTFQTYASGQGANLLVQEDGKMFLFSAFSSHEGPPGNGAGTTWGKYGSWCGLKSADLVFLGYGQSVPFRDQVYLSEVDFEDGSAKLVYQGDIERTQRAEACVFNRPSFRFAGAVATISGSTDLIGLWSGRQNAPARDIDDDFEVAVQVLKAPAGLPVGLTANVTPRFDMAERYKPYSSNFGLVNFAGDFYETPDKVIEGLFGRSSQDGPWVFNGHWGTKSAYHKKWSSSWTKKGTVSLVFSPDGSKFEGYYTHESNPDKRIPWTGSQIAEHILAKPDLSARWTSKFGSINFEQGHYGSKTSKLLTGSLSKQGALWVYDGEWGKKGTAAGGEVKFVFEPNGKSFTGNYISKSNASPWDGSLVDDGLDDFAASIAPRRPVFTPRPWTSPFGDIYWLKNYYRSPNQTLKGRVAHGKDGKFRFIGRWGRKDNASLGGEVQFTFSNDGKSFEGWYESKPDGPKRTWTGEQM